LGGLGRPRAAFPLRRPIFLGLSRYPSVDGRELLGKIAFGLIAADHYGVANVAP
jgi:hypothetical protein